MNSTRTTGDRLRTVVVASMVAAGPIAAAGPADARAAASTTVFTGTVTGVDGKPLQDVEVVAEMLDSTGPIPFASARTQRNGTYRLAVEDSPVALRLQFSAGAATGGTSPTGYADRCFRQGAPICTESDPTLRLNGRPQVINAVLAEAGVLRGRVTDSLGRGVGGLPVETVAQASGLDEQSRSSFVFTDLNGNYTASRLNPYQYSVAFGDPLLLATPASPARDGYTARTTLVTLAAGRTLTRDITLVGGGAITGTVVDQTGTAVPDADVTWIVTPTPDDGWPSTTTRTDGTFALHLLSAMAAPLCATAPGFDSNCTDDPQDTPPTTVRQFRTTDVRLVLHRTS